MSGMGGRIDRLLGALSADQEKTENVSTRDLARCLIALACEGHPSVPEIEAMIGVEPGALLAVHQRLWERAKAESSWLRKTMRDALPKMSKTSVPVVARSHDRLQPLPPRLDGLPERHNGRPQPRVIRTKGDR